MCVQYCLLWITHNNIYIIFFFIPDLTSAYKLSSIEAFNHSVTVENWTETTVYYAVIPMVKATIETIFRCVKERKGWFTLYNTWILHKKKHFKTRKFNKIHVNISLPFLILIYSDKKCLRYLFVEKILTKVFIYK